MSLTTTESRSGQAATLNGSSTYQGTASTPDPTRAEAVATLRDLLPKLADESTPEDAENDYWAQAQLVQMTLRRDINRWEVRDAMEALNAIGLLQAGNCLVEMYGWPNTDENRDHWLDQENQNLTGAIHNLTFGIPA